MHVTVGGSATAAGLWRITLD